MGIAENIRLLRKEKGFTQKQLGEVLNVPYRTIMNWERGVREPNSQSMVILEEYFNVSGAFLRGETTQRTPMEKWEDHTTMQAIDEGIEVILKNITLIIHEQQNPIKERFYTLLVELQRVFKYDFEIQALVLDTFIQCIYATSRLTDITLEMPKSGFSEADNRYNKILEKELSNIEKTLETIKSFVETGE